MRARRPAPTHARVRCLACAAGLALGGFALSGCTAIAVVDLAASAVVGTVGLAVDAAVGTAKIGGKIIGKTADAVLGGDDAGAAAKGN